MNDATASLRKSIYLLIGTVGVAVMIAKIVGAENVFEPSRYAPATEANFGFDREGKPTRTWPTTRPEPSMTFGSNDRSRWATIKSLVDNGTYEIGRRGNFTSANPPFDDTGIIFEGGKLTTLDVVMNPATGVYYSSKPPLLSTVLAGEYWLLKKTLNWSIDCDRWPVMATILITVNVLPFVLYLFLLMKLIETYGTTDFGKLFAFTLAALGTFLTTFSMTLNNHSPAAYCVLFAVYPLLIPSPRRGEGRPDLSGRGEGEFSPFSMFQVGFFAGLAAALELPAAAFTAAVMLPLFWMRPKQTMLFAVPGLLIVVVAWLACNYAALGKFMPAYGDFGGPWYDYPGSHWKKFELQRAGEFVPGIDFNQEKTPIYAFHLAFGHHGWFSLTPAFFAAGFGLVMLTLRSGGDIGKLLNRSAQPVFIFQLIGAMTLVVSITVFAFYLTRTSSYNYGGNTSGPRWLFWLIPLWILGGLPAFDALGRTRLRQFLAALLLGFSVLSAFYPATNPWRNPWILQLLERTHVVNYDLKPKP